MPQEECRWKKSEDGRRTTDAGLSVFKIDHPTIRNPQSRATRDKSATCPAQGGVRNSSRGQAMAEYVIIAGLLMASLGILTVLFVTFKEYGGRILALVSSEYP
ncbi:MAG: hypothetical protein ABIJ53_06430 [Verrucomicrobiota bacterium]